MPQERTAASSGYRTLLGDGEAFPLPPLTHTHTQATTADAWGSRQHVARLLPTGWAHHKTQTSAASVGRCRQAGRQAEKGSPHLHRICRSGVGGLERVLPGSGRCKLCLSWQTQTGEPTVRRHLRLSCTSATGNTLRLSCVYGGVRVPCLYSMHIVHRVLV